MKHSHVNKSEPSARSEFQSGKTAILVLTLLQLMAPLYAIYQQWDIVEKMENILKNIAHSMYGVIFACRFYHVYTVYGWKFGKKVSTYNIDDVDFLVF